MWAKKVFEFHFWFFALTHWIWSLRMHSLTMKIGGETSWCAYSVVHMKFIHMPNISFICISNWTESACTLIEYQTTNESIDGENIFYSRIKLIKVALYYECHWGPAVAFNFQFDAAAGSDGGEWWRWRCIQWDRVNEWEKKEIKINTIQLWKSQLSDDASLIEFQFWDVCDCVCHVLQVYCANDRTESFRELRISSGCDRKSFGNENYFGWRKWQKKISHQNRYVATFL